MVSAREDGRPLKILCRFPKECLTKSQQGNPRSSTLDRLKVLCQNSNVVKRNQLLINQKHFNVIGQQLQSIEPPNQQIQYAQQNPTQQYLQMGYMRQDFQTESSQSQYYGNNGTTKQDNSSNDYYKSHYKQKERFIPPIDNDDSNVSQSIFQTSLPEKDLEQLFPKIPEEKLVEIKRNYEKKNMTSDEKVKKLFDEFKIKQFKSMQYNGERKNLRCPYFKCSKQFNKGQSLRNHIKKSHPKLSEIELNVDDQGVFTWNEKALDYCLLLGQIYPSFVKQIVKEVQNILPNFVIFFR